MEISNVSLVYFSATYTTAEIAKAVAVRLGGKITEYDITQTASGTDVQLAPGDVLVIGAPVYAGRIPAAAVEAFGRFKGRGTPAVVLCVYGNRDYDDALLELKQTAEANGFRVVSAGAFIARHAIFPQVAAGRPDEADRAAIRDFGDRSARIIHTADVGSLPALQVPGNKPYKIPGKIPLRPRGDRHCNGCGKCAKLCPVRAIDGTSLRKTDKEKCIACGRCIVVCPQHARHFGGLLYRLAGNKFIKANSLRKESETFYPEGK